MNEQQRILEMIEKGQITAAEGMELLEALNQSKSSDRDSVVTAQSTGFKSNYKYLKIKVISENKSLNVNVNIPIRLLTTIGEMTDKMMVFIPKEAREEMEAKGIDITSIDFARIIEEILSGTLEDPTIVDVETWDEGQQAMIKVKIYVE